jgi:MtN3 and saliva related transmembrane protein
MSTAELIGYIAATLTTVAFLPQAIKVIITKETEGISLWMYIIFATGVAFWFIYGMIEHIYPIIIANAVTLIFALVILIFKLKETTK